MTAPPPAGYIVRRWQKESASMNGFAWWSAPLVLALAGPIAAQSVAPHAGVSGTRGPVPLGSTTRVSVGPGGAQAVKPSFDAAISADGRYVAFRSLARLVPDDTNGAADIYVHDRRNGTTARASLDSAGAQPDADCFDPCISADGRYVAFHTSASNLVPGDTNGDDDVFVRDLWNGTTERVSVDSAGNEGDSVSGYSSISADGRWVAFASSAGNLVPGDTNGWPDVFVRDRWNGTTERVSVDSSGIQGDWDSGHASISADGRYVAFDSYAAQLVPGDTNAFPDVFVHDRQSGITVRISVDSSGVQGDGESFEPAISADGRCVAFWSAAHDLVPGDTNAHTDVFVHDLASGLTERVSVDSHGAQAGSGAWGGSISAHGRYVAFQSLAASLVPGDSNASLDVFVRDRWTGTTERVSVTSGNAQGTDDSYWPSISADGRCVAFYSYATGLVPRDTNGVADVFLRERW